MKRLKSSRENSRISKKPSKKPLANTLHERLRRMTSKALVLGSLSIPACMSACDWMNGWANHSQRLDKIESPKNDSVKNLASVLRKAGASEAVIGWQIEGSNRDAVEFVRLSTEFAELMSSIGMSGNDIYSALIYFSDPSERMNFELVKCPRGEESKQLNDILDKYKNMMRRKCKCSVCTLFTHNCVLDEGKAFFKLTRKSVENPSEAQTNEGTPGRVRMLHKILKSEDDLNIRNQIRDMTKNHSVEELELLEDAAGLLLLAGIDRHEILNSLKVINDPLQKRAKYKNDSQMARIPETFESIQFFQVDGTLEYFWIKAFGRMLMRAGHIASDRHNKHVFSFKYYKGSEFGSLVIIHRSGSTE